jgi:aryl-alcohol dehydrogenase-like predicted oxidoreductase
MDYGHIKGTDKPVARLVLGTMVINTDERDTSFALLDQALELGYTTLDTAHIYAGGDSERAIGDWMQERGNREQIFIITKGAHPNLDRKCVTKWDIGTELLDSLARLKTDYVDLYLLHRDDPDVPVGEIVDALDEHVRAGRIHAFGGSNWTHERIAEANEYAASHNRVPFAASSPNFSLAEQIEDPWGTGSGSVTISGKANTRARDWYRQTGTPVFAWSSLARGFFSGRLNRDNYTDVADGACERAYCHEVNFQKLDRVAELADKKGLTIPQISLIYVISQPMPVYPLIGAQNREELEANLAVSTMRLTPDEVAYLDTGKITDGA